MIVLAVWAQSGPTAERFTATALSRADSTVRTSVEIDIHRWSDEAEGEQIAAAFRRRGVEAALLELTHLRSAGRLRSISGLSRTIRYAREMRFTGGSRYVLLLVDSFTPHEFFESTTTSGGDLSAITVWLGQKGDGEGQIASGTQLGIDAFGAVTVDVKNPPIVLPAVSRPTR